MNAMRADFLRRWGARHTTHNGLLAPAATLAQAQYDLEALRRMADEQRRGQHVTKARRRHRSG